ncbi:unnamed protein product [Owenia fusiformis]|uniref:Uncharacterized protein n=1 Tax=Owenia fusiformis TaxID=6347 RepID=A0A8J1XLH4_OWEFU|nr:unnamed protein product [Owenia fusiformis]
MPSWIHVFVTLLAITTAPHGKYVKLLSEVCNSTSFISSCQSCTNTSITCNSEYSNIYGPNWGLFYIPLNDISPAITTLNLEFKRIIGLKLRRHLSELVPLNFIRFVKRNISLYEYYPNLKYLSLAGNDLESFPKDAFKGLAIRELNLSMNSLRPSLTTMYKREEWGIFKQLPNITRLNMSRMISSTTGYRYNILEYLIPELKNLQNSTIEVIDFSETHHRTAKPHSLDMTWLMMTLKKTPIREIHLANNYIDELFFDGSTKVSYNRMFKRINVGLLWNSLSLILKDLELFDMSNIGLDLFNAPLLFVYESEFEYLAQSNIKVFKISSSQKAELDVKQYIEQSHTSCVIDMSIWKLEVLQLVNIALSSAVFDYFILSSFKRGCVFQNGNSLRILDISGRGKFGEIGGEIKGLTHLQELYFGDNNCVLSSSLLTCSKGRFESLKILSLRGNMVQLNEISSKGAFDDCNKLEHLDLSYNKLYSIPHDFFKNAKNLKTLDLSGNILTHIDVKLTELKHLTFLNLSHNKLEELGSSFLDELELIRVNDYGLINLEGNPLTCKCGDIHFINWAQENYFTFYRPYLVHCNDKNGMRIHILKVDHEELRKYCLMPVIISVTITTLTVGLIAMSAFLIYKYRFRIQYLGLLARAQFRRRNAVDDAYYFDGFLSYSSQDNDFSHNTLIHRLEGDFGYKLCFDERNFLGGHVLEELVTVAMNHSRKIILVITEDFLRSRWCTFEMEIANGVLATRGCNCMVLLLRVPLNTIPAQLIKPRLRSLLENRLYIEWSEEEDRQKLFWQKLKDTLGNPCNAELTNEHRRNEYLVFDLMDNGICDEEDEL